MIRFDNVTVVYPDAPAPTLQHVDLQIDEGEFALVVGLTGVGKSTLLGAVNGLVPHFTGGTLHGAVTVAGRDTRTHRPRDLADLVGVVGQDPLAGFVTDTVEEELAYAMEQLAVPSPIMRKRVEETLDVLGIAPLRHRALRTLSGGQQQRVAIGSVLAAGSRILVLDEPTSALDPTSAEEVLAAVLRLVHDLGVTALVAEHRLERVVEYADRLVHLPGGGRVQTGPPSEMLQTVPLAPPVVELGRIAGWTPLPLSVRDARRVAPPLRDRLAGLDPTNVPRRTDTTPARRGPAAIHSTTPLASPGGPVLLADKIVVTYGALVAVREVTIELGRGEIRALMGRNGSGKSSLLWALTAALPRRSGRIRISGSDVTRLSTDRVRALVRLVPQTPGDLLFLETVAAECRAADTETGADGGTSRDLLDRLAPGIADDTHPRDLSEGQRLALALAVQLCARPPLILLDEPTRGLDYRAKRALADVLSGLAAQGRGLIIATHDVEFAAMAADRVTILAGGELVAEGDTAEILGGSPAFAPQVNKVLAPAGWLTVDQVAAGLSLVKPS